MRLDDRENLDNHIRQPLLESVIGSRRLQSGGVASKPIGRFFDLALSNYCRKLAFAIGVTNKGRPTIANPDLHFI